MASSVTVVCVDNQVGLRRDRDIVSEVLRGAGIPHRVVSPWGYEKGVSAANIFLEIVEPRYFPDAAHQVVIPNPEWWFSPWDVYLRRPNVRVWAKTDDAARAFARLSPRVERLGFTSRDARLPGIPKRRQFLHVAGKSSAKGTAACASAWARHPEWPPLVVVIHPDARRPLPVGPNFRAVREYLPDAELAALQNESRFHICPSEYEGFGHYIWEGLSCGACVLTTDAAPMNAAVRPEWGLLARVGSYRVNHKARAAAVTVEAVEECVSRALALGDAEIDAMGERARAEWESNDRAFRARLPAMVGAL